MTAAVLAGLLPACSGPDGSARVQAHFTASMCRPGGSAASPSDFSFDAGYLATERFGGALLISIQKYSDSINNTDGLQIRVDLTRLLKQKRLIVDMARGQIERADAAAALALQTTTSTTDANVALSLYVTCPDFPSSYASQGLLSFDEFTLASQPADTGDNERLGGTVTATLTRAGDDGPIGTLQAVFEFSPPRRPLLNDQ